MRMVTGGAPGAGLSEMWETMRDTGKPYTWAQVRDYADAKTPMPPSKAHVKRLKRSHEPRSEKRGTLPPCPERDFFQAQMVALGKAGVAISEEIGHSEGVAYARGRWQDSREERYFAGK